MARCLRKIYCYTNLRSSMHIKEFTPLKLKKRGFFNFLQFVYWILRLSTLINHGSRFLDRICVWNSSFRACFTHLSREKVNWRSCACSRAFCLGCEQYVYFLSHSGREILLSFIKIYFASGKCVEETRFKDLKLGHEENKKITHYSRRLNTKAMKMCLGL